MVTGVFSFLQRGLQHKKQWWTVNLNSIARLSSGSADPNGKLWLRRWVGGPRTRERRAEWRVGGPCTRESGVQWRKWRGPRALGCSGLGVFHAVGRSVWVQQHCGVGSCTAVASWCGGVCPFYSSTNTGTLQLFDSRKSAMVGGNCGCAFSPLSSLWLEFGRVDVPIQPASEYSWAVTRVDVPIQPDESVVFFSFCFLPMASQGRSLIFFYYINRNALVECRSFKKKSCKRKNTWRKRKKHILLLQVHFWQ